MILSPIMLLGATCAVLACGLNLGWWSPRWPFYRPVAAVVTWWVAASTADAALQHLILHPARITLGSAPYPWPARGAFLADVALRVSWPFALVAACLAVFSRRRPWPAAVAWLLCSAALCAAYPSLRGPALLNVEAAIATACWVWCAVLAWRSFDAGHIWIASHIALVPILGAQLAVIVSVAWGDPVADWGIARLVQGAGYVLLIALQVRTIVKNRARAR